MSDELKAKLKFGGELHNSVSRAVRDRLRRSQVDMQERYAALSRSEEQFTSYIKTKDLDRMRHQKKDLEGIPDYTTIEVPYSYGIAMSAHTYYCSVFLSRSPIFQFQGRTGKAQQQEQSVEAWFDYMTVTGQNMVPLFIWLLDPIKYGFGVVGQYWCKESQIVPREIEEPVSFFGIPMPGAPMRKRTIREEVPGYRGIKLFNVRPQDFFPDTRVPLVRFQEGEFCGRFVEIPWHEIQSGPARNEYFNIEELKKRRDADTDVSQGGMLYRDRGADNALQLPNEYTSTGSFDLPAGVVKAYEVHVKLVPSEWKLGSETRHETWVFTITADRLIIRARPLGLYHNKFPFDVLTSEPEGYGIFNPSLLERIQPLQNAMTWLLNAHFYNVRAALNNQFLVDPSRVVVKDIQNPRAGKLIRLKPLGYGGDVRQMIQQFQVSDITRANLSDLQVLEVMAQRVFGVNDNVMGQSQVGGRRTATESRQATQSSISRLKTQCEWFSAQGWTPLAMKMLQTSQQLLDARTELRVVGDIGQLSPSFVPVDVESITGAFDFVPLDGTLPTDRFAQANLWQMLMGQMRNFPQIMQTYDVARIFAWVAQLAGMKNLNQFRLQVQDPNMLARQAQAGNIVPTSQAMGELTEPQQIPGMGQTT